MPMSSDTDLATPGDVLAVIEEFVPQSNVYVYDGNIISSVIGVVRKDMEKREIEVKPLRAPVVPRKDDIIHGVVVRIKDIYALVNIFYVESLKKYFHVPFTGILHVMNISSTFVKSIYDAVGYGDVIKARVISEKGPPFSLSTRGRDLGVIYARCSLCMRPLRKSGFNLYCPRCRVQFKRKLSYEYLVK